MDLHPDLTDLLTEFARFEVDYLVIGGWAVAVHGEPRYTKDLDLWVGPDPANFSKVMQALTAFGAPPGLLELAKTATSEEFLFFGTPPARVDILRKIPGLEFHDAWVRRVMVPWNTHAVAIIGRDDLIVSKRAAGRPRDLADVKALERK